MLFACSQFEENSCELGVELWLHRSKLEVRGTPLLSDTTSGERQDDARHQGSSHDVHHRGWI